MSLSRVKRRVTVEIIVVGNELLNGTTLDTNSHWMSKKLEKIGAFLSRKTTIRDNIQTISDTLRGAFRRRPNWIITIGGLGPTFDDLTLSGVAAALHVGIGRNSLAVSYLKESYRRRGMQPKRLIRASLKMAEIPKRAIPLQNPLGSAPGVLLDHERISIVSLPGVPSEMKAIFGEHVEPRILVEIGESPVKRKQLWIETVGVRESLIAPDTKKIMDNYRPDVYLKSHPMGFDKKHRSIIHFQLILENASRKGSMSFDNASKELRKAISKYGIVERERVIS
jgi:nicotinamide-nucleotide amidase